MFTTVAGTVFTDPDLWGLKQALATATDPGTPPPPPPPPPPIITPPPAGFVYYDLPWANNFNSFRVPMRVEDQVVIRFLVPPGASGAGAIGMAEYASARVWHYGVISTTPGNFNGGLSVAPFNASFGNTLSWSFQVGGAPQQWIMLLQPGTYYYLNLRNTDQYGNLSGVRGQDCTMFLDLRVPQ